MGADQLSRSKHPRMYGLTSEQTAPGTTLRSILDARVAAGITPEDVDNYVDRRLQEAGSSEPFYAVNHMRDGRVFAISHQPMSDGGCVAVHQDVTAQKRAEMKIAYMAQHDSLTDLVNRAVLMEKIEEALARLHRGGDKLAVLMLDLDLFKTVNDSLGHPIGDALLKAVAHRLSNCAQETDTIARIGGDEFAILVTTNGDPQEAAVHTAERLLEAVSAHYELDGHDIDIGVSIGIALGPKDGTDVEQLIKSADLALYKAKAEGRNTYCLFAETMSIAAGAHHALQSDLRNAPAIGEFELHYQPIVKIKSDEIAAIEALVRWRNR
jgi:diguanylate cyclase (GGDEF)-like protein